MSNAADESSEVRYPTSAFRELELKRAASHEAGHAAVSVHLGMRFHPVTIHSSGMYDGSLEPDLSLEDESRAAEIARKQVVIAYAGAAAQRMLHPEQPESQIIQCSESDQTKIKGIVTDFPSIGTELEQAEREAASLVQQLRNVVRAIANALLSKRILTWEEAKRIHTAGTV